MAPSSVEAAERPSLRGVGPKMLRSYGSHRLVEVAKSRVAMRPKVRVASVVFVQVRRTTLARSSLWGGCPSGRHLEGGPAVVRD